MPRISKYSLITLFYWLITGVIPISCILIEFGGELGFDYAKFYSPLFFYPLIFGVCSVYFSLRSISYFFSLPSSQRFNLSLSALLLFVLILSIVITSVEYSGSPAIWEVKKAAIESTIANTQEKNQFITSWDKFVKHFREHPGVPKKEVFNTIDEWKNEEKRIKLSRNEFNRIIVNASNNAKNWSSTKYSYLASFFFQQLALFCLFLTISFISIPKFQEYPQTEARLKKHLIWLSMSLSFSLIWLFMRLSFDSDKLKLYGSDLISTGAATFVIGLLYVLAMLYLTIKLWFSYKEKFQVVYNIVFAMLGFTATVYSTQSGINFLGSNASPQNYIMCIIAVLIILFPWYLAYRDTFD
jgi:hypothetical protein